MKSKIKILHITQAVGGGVERYIQMLLKYLDHTVYENYLLVSNDTDARVFEHFSEHIEQIDMRREIGTHDLVSVMEVRKVLQKIQPDIIYAHSSKAGALARLANLGLHKVCIYNAHGWAFNINTSFKKQMLYVLVEKALAPLCDRIVCISEAEKTSALKKKICGPNKMQVIMNGIDVPAYAQQLNIPPNRRKRNIPDDAFVVGMVGRVCQQKAPDVFIRAAEMIKDRIPNAFFIIVGSGDLENEIRQFAFERGLSDSLLLTGWVSEPMEYIQCFDVAVLLSRWEGFGLVIAEYMLAQKPIVATRVDAIPELIQHGENGLLVEPDDPAAAAEAVYRVYADEYLREHLTKGHYRQVQEKYNICRVAKEHDLLFQSCFCDRNKKERV